jgi:hypothetical protein
MVYRGHVENGVIQLDDAVTLPNGTEVRVEVVVPAPAEKSEEEIPTLYERLRPIIGAIKDSPPDASVNIDHYLYGHPKK